MNKKNLMNWLRAGLALQQICEINGCTRKADKSFQKAKNGIKPGDWIVRPYSPHLVNILRKAVEKGRLVVK